MQNTFQKIVKFSKRASLILFLGATQHLFAQTGYYQNFNSVGVPPGFDAGAPAYVLSNENQTLKIAANKQDNWSGIMLTFPSPLNLSLSTNRKVSFKIKTDTTTRKNPYEIRVAMFNVNTTNQVGGERTHKVIYPTGKWQTVTFDFTAPSFSTLNFNSVASIQLVAQPLGYFQNATFFIDDLAVGDNGVSGQAAVLAPYFLGFENQDIFINTSRTLNLMNAVDANSLSNQITFTAISSNPSILPDPTFSNSPFLSNSYTNFTSGNGSNGTLLTSRSVKMNLLPVANQFGMVTVTVTASVQDVTTFMGTTTMLGTITLTGAPSYKTPNLTTTPISGSPQFEGIINLTDNNNNNKWLMTQTTGNAIIGYATPFVCNAYSMVTGNDAEDRDPKSWTLQGSNTNNGTDWVTISNVLDGLLPSARNTESSLFTSSNTVAYSFYRWNILSVKSSTNLMQISELRLGNVSVSGTTTGLITVNTVLSSVGGSISPYHYIFTTNVKRNVAPTIGNLPTMLTLGSDKTKELFFDNIFDGNGEVNQMMTITGTSSDQSVVSNSEIVVSFNGIGLTAKAYIKPVSFSALPVKTCNVTFTIKDNGGTALGGLDQTQYVIPITVYPNIYNQPYFNPIANQVDNITNQGLRVLTITGITDGNNASRIASIVATSSNSSILSNPNIIYTIGKNTALLSYNSQIVGSVQISVTATNFGAPTNSNGNSSFTQVFTMTSQSPPINGFIEPFTDNKVVGPAQSDGRSSTIPGSWFVESQGSIQNFSVNTNTGAATLVQIKPGTAPGYFAGIWYKPGGGSNLFDFKNFPYLSVNLSTTNTSGKVAIDLWDVNNVRYGLSSELAVTGSPTTYTFCYNGIPSPGFDFSKIKLVLFNFGVTQYNEGTGNWATYNGTYTISNLRIGNEAQGFGSCPPNISNLLIGDAYNPFHLSTEVGLKTITVNGISAGSNPVIGRNPNPVNLSVSGGLGANLLSFNPTTGVAIIQYTTSATTGTTVISISGNAIGSTPLTRTFTVSVLDKPAATNLNINNDLAANMSDGQKGQTIDGSPMGVCEIFDPLKNNYSESYFEILKEVNMQSMRIGIYDFEPKNDNSDPNVLDKTKLNYDAMQVEFFKKASDAGVKRFLVTFFSPPNFTKYNRESGVPAPPGGYILTNTIDSAYYNEYAEYAVAFVQGVKEKSGVDIWGLCIGNEIQFNQTYQSVVLNTQQYVEIIRTIGRRFAAEGIKTFLWGVETLQAQDSENAYMKACQADPEVRNYFSGYAVHSYAADGVGQGGPNSGNWSQILADSRDTRSNMGLTNIRNSLIPTVGPNGEPHNGNGGTGITVHMTETSQGGLASFREWSNAMNIFGAVTTALNYGNVSGWYYIGIGKDADMFYTYKHINKFVWGGSRRVPATSPVGTSASTFRNPDGSLTILLGNDGTQMRNISLTGVNIPSKFKAYLSVENDFWKDLGTISGSVVMPPNSLLTLWGDGNALVAANGVTISGGNIINAAGGTLQLAAKVGPENLLDKSVIWSVTSITGLAQISNTGLLTAEDNGTVRVRATSIATPTVFGEVVVTISGQINESLIGLTLTTTGLTMNEITVANGSIEFLTIFNPTTTTQKSIGWSIVGSQTIASLSPFGFLSALNNGNGVITVTATSLNNTTISAFSVVTISGQALPIEGLTITGANEITNNGGTFNLIPSFSPLGTTQTNVVYSLSPLSIASVSPIGLVTALDNGVVTITATSLKNPSIKNTLVVSVSGQNIKQVSVSGLGGMNDLNSAAGTLQMIASSPQVKALSNESIVWTILSQKPTNPAYNGNDLVTINSITGLITSRNFSNGLVTVSGFFQNSTLTSIAVISVSNQREPVLFVNSGNTFKNLTYPGHSFTATGVVLPSIATDKSLNWKAIGAGQNLVVVNTLTGLIEASDASNGLVTILGYSASDPNLSFTNVISVSGNSFELSYSLINNDGDPVLPILSVSQSNVIIIPTFLPQYDGLPNLLLRSSFVNYTAQPSSALTVSSDGSVQIVSGTTDLKGFVTLTYQRNPLLKLTIEFNISTTSIKSTENVVSSVKISPVPFENVLTIKNLKVGDKLYIYNSTGALMTNLITNDVLVDIDTKDFATGIYNVVVISEGKSTSFKVSK